MHRQISLLMHDCHPTVSLFPIFQNDYAGHYLEKTAPCTQPLAPWKFQ